MMMMNRVIFSKFLKLINLSLNSNPNSSTFNGISASGHRPISFITTPIFYVNGPPHLGHLYTLLLGDAGNRFEQLKSPVIPSPNFFTTGTDEHGLKIQKAALESSPTPLSPQLHTDKVSNSFRILCEQFGISNTDFIRTTENRHKIAVNEFWTHLDRLGHIYKKSYEGWYSLSEEAFLPESQLTDKVGLDGKPVKVSTENGLPVEWTSEINYMFDLRKFVPQLVNWIEKDDPIYPPMFKSPILKWLEDCPELSISRPASRITWGIPVPGDPTQVVYVWLDALVNYLTVAGYPTHKIAWPPTHLVGKDILKFHAIYWPAFLLAAGIELPSKIICHSHWTVNNMKMSKSLGNVVDPFDLLNRYGVDAVRYFLLREGVLHSDGNFNEEKLIRVVNAELADTFGNLLSRCSSKALNPNQIWPQFSEESFPGLCSKNGHVLKEALESLPEKVIASYQDYNFYRGMEHIMGVLRLANLFVEEEKPWILVKNSSQDPSLLLMTSLVMETLRVTGTLLLPIVPNLSTHLLDRLNVPDDQRNWRCLRPFIWEDTFEGRSLKDTSSILFRRIQNR